MITPFCDTLFLDAASVAFAADYGEARRCFLDACLRAGLRVDSRRHPLTAPDGTVLACDVAWSGPRAARRVLVMVSGTHGVEGFCGSAIQTDWLLSGGPDRLPDGCAVLLVHAINPHGFAWLRRVTEDGVDLNRNFVDFSQPPPVNEGYVELADAILPPALEGPPHDAAKAKLAAYRATHGKAAYEQAVSAGQYVDPRGLFYGGTAPTWSRLTLEEIALDYDVGGRAALCVLDLHTGLGPFGHGELICDHPPGSLSVTLARQWFGDSVTEPALGTSSSVPKVGLVDYFWHGLVGDAGCMLTLEFGTRPVDEVLDALRADHWLHAYGSVDGGQVDWDAARTRAIKAQLMRTFCPDGPEWREMVLFRGRQVIRQALAGLAGVDA